MKKLYKILIICLLVLTISACKSKDEYKTIELSGTEMVDNIGKGKDFIVAFLKSDSEKSQNLLNSLEKIAKDTKQTIYYSYVDHINNETTILLYATLGNSYNYNQILVIENNKPKTIEYKSYQDLYNNLKNYKFNSKLDKSSEKSIAETIGIAHSYYEDGKIGSANNKLNEIYSSKEAKAEIEKNKYYKIINGWDTYTSGHKKNTFIYHHFIFNLFDDTISLYEKEGKIEEIEIPKRVNDKYTTYYYYIKNGIIYTSQSEDGKYQKRYKINSLSDEVLNITDLKNNLELNLLRRSI